MMLAQVGSERAPPYLLPRTGIDCNNKIIGIWEYIVAHLLLIGFWLLMIYLTNLFLIEKIPLKVIFLLYNAIFCLMGEKGNYNNVRLYQEEMENAKRSAIL